MKIKNEEQVFNLMDTNGRRNDVINALQGYLSILSDLTGEWGNLPNSLSQYMFYKQAIELSPDVFSKHDKYDDLQIELEKSQSFKNAIENDDIEWIQKHKSSYIELIDKFDVGIEDRARHYTSNLVKLGFATSKREISPVGKLLLDKEKLGRDELEKLLPIDNVNIIYLRQLLKLRVYDNLGHNFYSPFLLAIYLLLKKERVSENDFCEMVQGINPYFDFSRLDNFINQYSEGNIVKDIVVNIPEEIGEIAIPEAKFNEYFKNQKSSSAIAVYWEYYNLLYGFSHNKTVDNLNNLLTYYEENKAKINKAFGCGKNIFDIRTSERPTVDEFIRKNKKIFENNLNKYLYIQFKLSKQLDQIKEYSDTTKRIFKATGIISFENGYVELACKELYGCIFKEDSIRTKIFGNFENYQTYELNTNNYFCSNTSLSKILQYSSDNVSEIINAVKDEFGVSNSEQITKKVAIKRQQEFARFIDSKYPLGKVKELLGLFNDRHNDDKLKEYVSPDATVPTIYEFIVGIAWYYFSGKKVDILSSYNLTMSANFEPLIHAGGGQGDIVICEKDKVVMLEATLMNASSQKRGEWEPVLRHSVNLKIEEELKQSQRKVLTFFIADEFDVNTINIWKAVASVPLQSTINRETFTDNVVIMPLNSAELSRLTDKPNEYDEIINNVHDLFEVDKNDFNLNWREEFIREIV